MSENQAITIPPRLLSALLEYDQYSDRDAVLRAVREQVIKELHGGADTDEVETVEIASHIELLKARAESFQESINYEEGDLVVWKDGMKNRRIPADGEPAIVVSIERNKAEIPLSEEESSSNYYREPLDLQLGCLGPEDQFTVFHFDSRRFRKFDPAE